MVAYWVTFFGEAIRPLILFVAQQLSHNHPMFEISRSSDLPRVGTRQIGPAMSAFDPQRPST